MPNCRSNQNRPRLRISRIAPLAGALLLGYASLTHADALQEANQLFKQGKQSQALDKVDGVLSAQPKDAQARFLKGLILTEQGKNAEAIRIFTALTEDYPQLPEPYNNLAVLYARQGQYDKAKLTLEMAIRTHPSYATAHENLGDIYAKLASQAYDRALQLDRGNTAPQTKLAMIRDLFSGAPHSKPAALPPVAAPQAVAAPQPVAPAKVVASLPPAPVAPAKPVAATPPVAVAPVETPKAAKSPANNGDEVMKTLRAWAGAWSAQNTKKYLSYYARTFKVPDGQSRHDWEASRKERISAPKSIQVEIGTPSVHFDDPTHVTVKFRQSYRASHMKTSSTKTMLLVKSGGEWQIQEERVR